MFIRLGIVFVVLGLLAVLATAGPANVNGLERPHADLRAQRTG